LAFSLLLLLLLQAFSWKRSSRLYQRENGVIISLEKQTHDKKEAIQFMEYLLLLLPLEH
jgi:hypothetical protein